MRDHRHCCLSALAIVLCLGAAPVSTASLPVDGEWLEQPPLYRFEHTAIRDPVRNRILLFGGSGASRDYLWEMSLSGEALWSRLHPAGTPPVSVRALSSIYDPVRDRMIVYGGNAGPGGSRVWALSLNGVPTWTEIITAGPQPVARYQTSATYDPIRDRMIVAFGTTGFSFTSYFNEVWSLSFADPPVWTQLSPTGPMPAARGLSSSIYDPLRDRILYFGGFLGYTEPDYFSTGEVWSLSFQNGPEWAQVTPQGTPPLERMAPGAIYDPVRDRMVVYGGLSYMQTWDVVWRDETLTDTWSLDLAGSTTWTELTVSGTVPPEIWLFQAVFDPAMDRLVVTGGQAPGWRLNISNAFSLSLSGNEWSELTPQPPPSRSEHVSVFDPVGRRMIVFGGNTTDDECGLDDLRNDLWALDADTFQWSALNPAGTPPSPRDGMAAVFDPFRHRVLLFGGHDGTHYLNETWSLSLAGGGEWAELSPGGALPAGVNGAAAVFDPVRDRMLVIGGSDGIMRRPETWALSLSGSQEWQVLSVAGSPPGGGVTRHSAVYDPVRDRVIVFGGYGSVPLNETHTLNLTGTASWEALSPAGTIPPAHYAHTAVYDIVSDRMIVFGGRSSSTVYDQTWALSLNGATSWVQLAPPGTLPARRVSHTAVMDTDGRQLILFGGRGSQCGSDRNDAWSLSFGSAQVGVREEPPESDLALGSPWPNPFSGSTTISFVLEEESVVELQVFDAAGRLVRRLMEGPYPAGRHDVNWNGTDDRQRPLGSGLYFLRIQAGGLRSAARVILRR